MPIYEYECDACHKRFEILQKISDPLKTQCPSCQQEKLRKRVTAAAFRLKGGGWYETDFKDKKAQKNVSGGDDTAKPDKAASTEGGSAGSESKPATAEKPAAEAKVAVATTKTSTD